MRSRLIHLQGRWTRRVPKNPTRSNVERNVSLKLSVVIGKLRVLARANCAVQAEYLYSWIFGNRRHTSPFEPQEERRTNIANIFNAIVRSPLVLTDDSSSVRLTVSTRTLTHCESPHKPVNQACLEYSMYLLSTRGIETPTRWLRFEDRLTHADQKQPEKLRLEEKRKRHGFVTVRETTSVAVIEWKSPYYELESKVMSSKAE